MTSLLLIAAIVLAFVAATFWKNAPKPVRQALEYFREKAVQLALAAQIRVFHAFHETRLAANAELGAGTHEDSVRRTVDAAVTRRHLLYKKGASDATIAVAGAADIPIGVVADEAAAIGDEVAVLLLGRGASTKRMVASEAIAEGVPVYAAAGGKVAATGTIRVGVSLEAATGDDYDFEVSDEIPNPAPTPIVVAAVAAAGSTVADAAALTLARIQQVSSDSALKGVKLPTTAAGMWGFINNTTATACELYAASGGTVNGGSANAPQTIPASKGVIWFATAADTIVAFELAAKAS